MHRAVQVFGAEILRLLLHVLHQLGAVDALGKPGKILDQGGQRKLAAGFVAADHQRLQIRARGVDGRRISGAAGANDYDIVHQIDLLEIMRWKFQFSTSRPLADCRAPSYTGGVMADHIRIVAILHIVLGALTVWAALAMLASSAALAALIGAYGVRRRRYRSPHRRRDWAAHLPGACCLGRAGHIAGIGLLKFRPWARIRAS